MKIAVLMSSYNGEKYIEEQLDSIIDQNCGHEIDIWVRDDGSRDSTKEILERYKEKGLINWYTGENLGPSKSFMDLLIKVKGYDFYSFADQDDYWMPEKLERAVKELSEKKDCQMYFSNACLVGQDLESLGRNVYRNSPKLDFKTLSCAGGLLGCTMVIKKELAEIIQTNPVPDELVLHDFYVSVLCTALGFGICYDERPSMKYRQHGGNVVGVSSGKLVTLKNRINAVRTKPKHSISEQCHQLLEHYSQQISAENKKWLKKVSEYQNSFLNRLGLAVSADTHYVSINMGMQLRMSILFGNR